MIEILTPCCGFSSISTASVVEKSSLKYNQCLHCGAKSLPVDELKHDTVDPDTSGPLSLVMKVLFSLRMIWLTIVLPEMRNRSTKILDAGCGDGQFLEFLKSKGYFNLFGYEINEKRFANAKLRGVNVSPNLETVTEKTNGFDLIFLWHVYEHVDRPIELLIQLLGKLESRGVLVLSVPNHESWQNNFFGRFSSFLDYGRHKWFLNDKYFLSLQEKFPEVEVKRLSDLNFEYEIFGWVDSISSFAFKKVNFVHIALKKGQCGFFEKLAAFFLSVLLFPFACVLSLFSILFWKGASTITFTFRLKP